MKGFFEVVGSRDEVVKKLADYGDKNRGVLYAVEFSDDTVKVGKTRHPRGRIKDFDKTVVSYGKEGIRRVAVTPIHREYDKAETSLHHALRDALIERELFYGTIETVAEKLSTMELDVRQSCKKTGCKGYFNLDTGKGESLFHVE